ncbi:MAG TPA: glycosyl hydrolase family 8 [Polyangiaceae bacterium]|jgi:endo-1,4-beta-D-glucanase Y|nr:glycosyl hydrolase family 8 [Polyangiaceae bacterium]
MASSVLPLVLVAGACSEIPDSGGGTDASNGGQLVTGVGGATAATGGKGGSSSLGGAGTGSSGAPSAGKPAVAGAGGAVGAGGSTGGAPPAAGTGGSTGGTAAGAGGAPVMLMRGPTPPSATSKFPFPQNRQSSHCTYPSAYDNADVKAVYDAWKNDLITSDGANGFRRVKRPAEHNLDQDSTVSEGIGYGMIIAVYMDDQSLFDDLWKYAQAHTWYFTPAGGGGGAQTILMNWYILKDGNTGDNGNGAATDADEDMAWALVMADKQWGGQGSLSKSYIDSAKQLLGDIWKYEIDNNRLPKNGSSWGDDNSLNISYFAPAYYRVFAQVTGEQRWGKDVVDYVYTVISQNLNDSNGNKTNGLVPAFSKADGSPANASPGQSLAFNYQYDSCRTPFRIGLDACFAGDARATDYVGKTSSFFSALGAANIKDGYELNGNPKPQFPDGFMGLSAAFIGPAGVGAMHSASYQGFVDNVWDLLKPNQLWCGGQYYDESWTVMAMLMLSGNFLDYTQY